MVPELELQRVWGTMDKLFDKLEKMSDQLGEVKESVGRIEAMDHSSQVAKLEGTITRLEARIVLLEADRNQRVGMVATVGWVHKLAPWVLPVALAVYLTLHGDLL